MNRLSLAIATKGAWDADQLLRDLRNAGVDASSEIHVACNPAHAPSAEPDGLTVHAKSIASLFDLWGLAIARAHADWIAILHADALPAPGWLAAMSQAIPRMRAAWSDGSRRSSCIPRWIRIAPLSNSST